MIRKGEQKIISQRLSRWVNFLPLIPVGKDWPIEIFLVITRNHNDNNDELGQWDTAKRLEYLGSKPFLSQLHKAFQSEPRIIMNCTSLLDNEQV